MLVLVCLAVLPSAAAALSGFYLRGEEGWFWYERELEPQETPEPAPPLPPPASAPTPSETPSGPPPLSSGWLRERHGFAVLPVSIDGAPLPGDQFPTFQRDAGQARALGVVSTPALFAWLDIAVLLVIAFLLTWEIWLG